MRYLILLLAILLPYRSFAASWEDCISGTSETQIYEGTALCVDLASGDLTTDILDVRKCDNFDVIYEPDTTSTGTAITVSPYNCTSATASPNSCGLIGGLVLSGTPPDTEIYGAAGAWIYFVGSGTIGATTPRILVHCNGPK